MSRFMRPLAAAGICAALAACGGDDDAPAPIAGTTVQTLSNRADLISGGQALVEVKLAPNASIARMKVDVDGTDVTSAFATTAGGRILGVVGGLKNGANRLNVRSTDDSFVGATLTITNHAIGGPVLLSSQTQPFVCATPVPQAASGTTPATNASGLSTAATDAQCNIAKETKLYYRTLTAMPACSFVLPDPSPTAANPNPATPANSCFQPYVAGTTPASAVAQTTTLAGQTVPYIVRVERGTINRGIYDIAVLFDPTKPWTATAPQAQWTGKVLITYGASTGQPRRQYRSEQSWVDDAALSRGIMVVDNSMTDSLYNSNRVLNAETTMMMKEHIIENYGEIRYTMSNGCSGGSINQNTAVSIYPGLLDGIQVSCDYPDSVSTRTEVMDCRLLVNAYVTPQWTALMAGKTQAQIDAKKSAINGHANPLGCHAWNNSFGFNGVPGNYVPTLVTNPVGAIAPVGASRNNCELNASVVYDAVTNPNGIRCGDVDAAVAVWGTVPGTNKARQVTDNTGVQYGLKALLLGQITAEEFVTINERVGGLDIDINPTAARAVGDATGIEIAYRSGILSGGRNLSKAAIIDLRGPDESNIHHIWRSFSERARLDQATGSHANQVMWRFPGGLTPPAASGLSVMSLLTMDTWLTNLNATAPKSFVNAERTQAQIVAAKPAAAFDFCYLSTDATFTTKVTDFTICDADPGLAWTTSPRQVAGGPLAENVLKCQLKPLAFADYAGVTFTAAQQTRLQAVFPTGVCDWSKPGVGQQDQTSPMTYVGGPGGVPLGPPPQSTAL